MKKFAPKKMNILIIMDPGIPIPPKHYGGHERLVYLFAKEYVRMGHEVTLLVSPGSEFPDGTVISFGKNGYPKNKMEGFKDIIRGWIKLRPIYKNFELIHNFGRLAYLLPCLNSEVKKIMSYGRQINPRNIKIVSKLPHKNIVFTAPSNDCVSTGNRAGKWVTIPNAIDFNHYDLKNDIGIDAPLIFLGRIERVKGCHIAIEVAKKSGNKLIIAGNISDLTEEYEYYKKEIEPHIDDEQIKYVGMVNDKQKNHYLGISKALLFPINVREAFGMVMIEAMACGTPVIGFAMGSVPEIIEEGISGFVVKDADGIIEALDKIGEINRSQCREAACSKYNVSIVAKEYLTIFNK